MLRWASMCGRGGGPDRKRRAKCGRRINMLKREPPRQKPGEGGRGLSLEKELKLPRVSVVEGKVLVFKPKGEGSSH